MNDRDMDGRNPYSLKSTEEPTDAQLQAVMRQVGEMARESTRKAQEELDRRMDDVRQYANGLYGR